MMEEQPSQTDFPANQILVIGTLDRQIVRGRELTRRIRRNDLNGYEEQLILQVVSPFGYSYALSLTLDERVRGLDLLARAGVGDRLAVGGRLAWEQQIDWRFPIDSVQIQHANDLVIRVGSIRPAKPYEEPGSIVRLHGIVAATSRIGRHPQHARRLLALTALDVPGNDGMAGTRMRELSSERVPLGIPLSHSHTPNLLRPGNRVIVEGMLDRYLVDLHGEEVEEAQRALDREWEQRRALIDDPAERLAGERRHQSRRRRMGQTARSRVIAGYVELREGQPATTEEARVFRRNDVLARTRPASARASRTH